MARAPANRAPADQAVLDAFGSYVRRLRKERRWTQEILGEHAELSRTYIGGIERGERNLAVINVNKLAKALEDDFSGFFPCRARPRRNAPRRNR